MNQYTKMLIDGQELDLYDSSGLPISIVKRVASADGDIQGDYAKTTLKVPATKNNVTILGESRRFRTFRVMVDGAPSFQGTAQVKRIGTIGGAYDSIEEFYELNLISSNASWFVLMGDKTLGECTDIVINWNAINVLAGFVANTTTRDWLFTFIKFREWENYTGTAPDIQYKPSYEETTAGLYFRPLLIEAFRQIGYNFESEFFDTTFGKQLFMPVPIPEKMSTEYNDKYLTTKLSLSTTYTVSNTSAVSTFILDTIDQAATANPTAYNTTTGEYTVPLDGYYEVICEFELGSTPPAYADFSYVLAASATGILYTKAGFGISQPTGNPFVAGATYRASQILKQNAGDIIKLTEVNGVAFSNPAFQLELVSVKMTIRGEATKTFGMPLDFSVMLGQLKVKDLIKGLSCMFNLRFEDNEATKTVRCEPADRWLCTSQTAFANVNELKEGFYKHTTQEDYTKKIDLKKKGRKEFEKVAGTYIYKFEQDSDDTIDFLQNDVDLEIYEGRFTMGSGAESGKTKEKKVPFFKKTIHVLDQLAAHPESTIYPQFPLIYPQNYILDPTANEEDADYDIGPRIMYFAGMRNESLLNGVDGFIEIFETGAKTAVPAAFMVNYNDSLGLDPVLSFGNEEIQGVQRQGLIQRFHLHDLVRRDKGHTRRNNIHFNEVDNANFSFRLKKFIRGQRYIVQEIDGYNQSNPSSTLFKFVLDVVPTQDDINNIQGSSIIGRASLLT